MKKNSSAVRLNYFFSTSQYKTNTSPFTTISELSTFFRNRATYTNTPDCTSCPRKVASHFMSVLLMIKLPNRSNISKVKGSKASFPKTSKTLLVPSGAKTLGAKIAGFPDIIISSDAEQANEFMVIV